MKPLSIVKRRRAKPPEIAQLCELLDTSTNVKRAFIARCERHGTGKALLEYHQYMAVASRGRTVAA